MVKHPIQIVRPVNLGIIAATMMVILFKYRYEEAENFYLYLALLIIPAILTAAAGYVVNDIYDIETDKINKPGKQIVGGRLSTRQAWMLYAVLSFVSLLVSWFFSQQYALINLCIAAMLYLYSAQLKGMPLIGNLVVALCSAAVIATCILYNSEGDKLIDFETMAAFFNFTSYIIFAFFISLIREVVKDLQDMEGDRAAGLKTYPVAMGVKGAKILVYIFCGMEIIFCGLYSLFAFWAADMYIGSAVMAIITLALFYLINNISRAKTSEEYGRCSKWLKYIMFAGVINLIFN